MATSYATESPANQALIDNYNANLRSALGQLGVLLNSFEAIQDQYNGEISALLSAWDAGEMVPNNTGLAGASVEETKEQTGTWQSYVDSSLSTVGSAAHRAEYVSAAGPTNAGG